MTARHSSRGVSAATTTLRWAAVATQMEHVFVAQSNAFTQFIQVVFNRFLFGRFNICRPFEIFLFYC